MTPSGIEPATFLLVAQWKKPKSRSEFSGKKKYRSLRRTGIQALHRPPHSLVTTLTDISQLLLGKTHSSIHTTDILAAHTK